LKDVMLVLIKLHGRDGQLISLGGHFQMAAFSGQVNRFL